ncbi:hypothetical protein CABS03_13261 [Colletotrichum abscissum]|uniref:C2H2-type domain-containing protein n=1 Tax=Colletotrichum abscissum TaxID=1671311 RepID=A0A9Q0B4C6_9PEZI|nr:hypothetical protein CABS02_07030 [Colletotrichum abscissum]
MATLRTWLSRLNIEDAGDASPPNLKWYLPRRRRESRSLIRLSEWPVAIPTAASSSSDEEDEFDVSYDELRPVSRESTKVPLDDFFEDLVSVPDALNNTTSITGDLRCSGSEGISARGYVRRGLVKILSKKTHAKTSQGAFVQAESSESLLLACPFPKYDPSREHIYRTHKQKPNCPRCHAIFKTNTEVETHLREKSTCEVSQGGGLVEGYDAAQGELLKSKKRRKGVETEEDKWKEIFKILFPDRKDVPDPFYRTPFDEPSTTTGTSTKEQDDAESIFTQDIPSSIEDETYSAMERAIGGALGKRKRSRVLDVCKAFAVKMIRQSTQQIASQREPNHVPKSSEARKINQANRQFKIRSNKQPLRTANSRLDEKPDEVGAIPSATQIRQPSEPFKTSGFSSAGGEDEWLSVRPNLENVPVNFGNDNMYWPTPEATFANVNGDLWLDQLLGNGSTLPGLFAEEPDTALEMFSGTAFEGVDPNPR